MLVCSENLPLLITRPFCIILHHGLLHLYHSDDKPNRTLGGLVDKLQLDIITVQQIMHFAAKFVTVFLQFVTRWDFFFQKILWEAKLNGTVASVP